MTVLNTQDRDLARLEVIDKTAEFGGYGACTRDQTRAMIAAIDDWWEANAASANAAIPLPARTAFGARAKALAFIAVLRRRYINGGG
jgi:hypothetical protein